MRLNESMGSVIEAGSNPNETHVLILEEGPGNPKNRCWYGQEAVTDAKEAFRGVRMFANHIGRKEMENRPERDVEAVVGRIKETYLKNDPQSGKLQCWGVAKVIEGDSCKWIKERINESVRAVQEGYPPIMQISINGDGDASARQIEGERWNYVNKITRGISVDYVPMGGIKKAGFRDIMESANLFSGGSMKNKFLQNLSAADRARYEKINELIEANVSPEDLEFLGNITTQLIEAEGDDAGDAADYEAADGAEDQGDMVEVPKMGDEAAYVLTLDNGDEIEVGEPHEIDAEGNAIWYDDDGQPYVLAAEQDDNFENDIEPDYGEDYGEDEIDFDQLAARYPALAAELAKEEMSSRAQEANMDPEALIGNLQEQRLLERTERVLMESRILAERKLAEAGVPRAILTADKLVGLDPESMDREIDRALEYDEYTRGMIREALTVHGGTSFSRGSFNGGNAAGVGKRILAGACKKY